MDSIVDENLLERAAAVESLETLLSNLAENHRRKQSQAEFNVDKPLTRNDESWRTESSDAQVEMAFADGGMISLALNRDVALSELEDVSDVARSENRAWVANVGIFRAFEGGAVAATEYAGLTNRISKNAEARSSTAELSEVEAEVANSQLHPLLASTSAIVGGLMLGLRRMRKATPLMHTLRRRS